MDVNSMKKSWVNPVKKEAQDSTLNIRGDFDKFTNVMRQIVTKREKKTISSSPGPVAS